MFVQAFQQDYPLRVEPRPGGLDKGRMCFHEHLQSRITEVAGEVCAIDLNVLLLLDFVQWIF